MNKPQSKFSSNKKYSKSNKSSKKSNGPRPSFRNRFAKNDSNDTSWQGVADWYNKSVGKQGQYFHENIIIPKSIKLLNIEESDSILDLGCGQGILSRYLPKNVHYEGVDLSPSLIEYANAKKHPRSFNIRFNVADITEPLKLNKFDFSHAAIVLALQNVENIGAVFQNAYKHLKEKGKFLIILNHPAFRIPRQSSWEIDDKNKIQYRRINRYYSPLKVPIDMTPGGKGNHKLTWSFHNPIEVYSEELRKNGFLIEKIEEWVSDKTSEGKAAKMENRAREEFPMFMAILAVKCKI